MELIQDIKILWNLKRFWDKIKEITMTNHNYFSTEFVAKMISQALILLGTLKGIIPINTALIASTFLTAIYMILRTIYKIKNLGQDLPDLPVTPIQ